MKKYIVTFKIKLAYYKSVPLSEEEADELIGVYSKISNRKESYAFVKFESQEGGLVILNINQLKKAVLFIREITA